MNDSIDQVIEEWADRPGRFVLHSEDECSFVKYTARDFLVVAAWRRAGPEAVLLGYLQTGADAHREADVSELRVALGLPAWVAPPAPKPSGPFHAHPHADVAAWIADPHGSHHPEQATPDEFARAVSRLGGAGSWTAVAALRLLERVEEAEGAIVSARRGRDAARLRIGELEREAGRKEVELEQVRRRSRSNAHALNTARVLVAEALRMMDAREELDEAKGRFARAHAAYREAEEVCDDGQP